MSPESGGGLPGRGNSGTFPLFSKKQENIMTKNNDNNTIHVHTVGMDFSSPGQVLPGYDGFFDKLMEIVRGATLDERLAEKVRSFVTHYVEHNTLPDFDCYCENSYTRNYIGRSPDSRWEALIMGWTKDNATSIHGHPDFALYFFFEGHFKLELFEALSEDKAKRVKTLFVDTPLCMVAVGEGGRFDNHLHRITCLTERGRSLHIYSDDALKGAVYSPADSQ